MKSWAGQGRAHKNKKRSTLLRKVLDKAAELRHHIFMHPVHLPKPQPIPIHEHCLRNPPLNRRTMERASTFPAVPGWGGAIMGATAICAALIAGFTPDPSQWLSVWLVEALVAVAIGVYAMHRKATAAGS